nr:MAG: replication associated protein [Arizlama virus]
MSQPAPAKDWCFTINNPEEWHIDAVENFDWTYLVYQVEVGEEGTPHLQGFMQLREKQRKTALLKHMKHARPEGDETKNFGYWAKRRGTPSEASHYCKKPEVGCACKHCAGLERFDDFVEQGHLSLGDATQRLAEVARVIKAKGLSHAIDRFPEIYCQYDRGMRALATHFNGLEADTRATEITVVWGASGKGKTFYARCGPCPYLVPPPGRNQTDFFGDYSPDRHQTVVVDDYYGYWKFTTFLRLCDVHPTEVQTKGGYQQFLARHIVFTSNVPPHEWYPNVLADPRRAESFHRRITNIIHFTEAGWVVTKGQLPWPTLPWMRQLDPLQRMMNHQAPPQRVVDEPSQPAMPFDLQPRPLSAEESARRAAWLHDDH